MGTRQTTATLMISEISPSESIATLTRLDTKQFMPKNPNAVKLGKLGGLASAKSLTKEQRIVRAKKAVKARELKRNLNQLNKDI